VTDRDWHEWHEQYDQPDSELALRLVAVRERIKIALDGAPPGPLRLLSMVAGQGRDVLPVLAAHPRGADVTARLVERDPRNAAAARAAVEDLGLSTVDVVTGDAALVDHYLDLAPAHVVVACGLFGNISDADIRNTIRHIGTLTSRGGTAIWTRYRQEPDLVPSIQEWYAQEGFKPLWLSEKAAGFGVGSHLATRDPRPPEPGASMFTFVGMSDPHPTAAADHGQ
jgi:hypothetical protein